MAPTVTHGYQPGKSRTSETLSLARPLPTLEIAHCLLGAHSVTSTSSDH